MTRPGEIWVALDIAGRGQLAAIIEADHLVGLIPGAPAAQAPGIDAEDIGRLQPVEGTTQGAQDDFLSLHRPLHGGREPEHRHLLGYRCLYGAPPEKRTFHLLSGADRSCAPDRKSTRLNSSHLVISYAVFCLKKKKP